MRGGGRTSSSMASTCPTCDAASPGPGTTPPSGLPCASRASFAALAFSLALKRHQNLILKLLRKKNIYLNF